LLKWQQFRVGLVESAKRAIPPSGAGWRVSRDLSTNNPEL
jgi:hypothetical protein